MREAPAEGAAAAPQTDAVELTVDASQPTTTLQVRLADGSRKVRASSDTHRLPPRPRPPPCATLRAVGLRAASDTRRRALRRW
jgi:hypothetical protein